MRPPALLREGKAGAPIFHGAEPLEALKHDPIQVLSVQLAFAEVLQRELFGRAEAEGRSFARTASATCVWSVRFPQVFLDALLSTRSAHA
jgi:hypothetical protein